MNKKQFKLISEKCLKKQNLINATYDVLFNGFNNNQAEIKHGGSKGSVRKSLASVKSTYELCQKVMTNG